MVSLITSWHKCSRSFQFSREVKSCPRYFNHLPSLWKGQFSFRLSCGKTRTTRLLYYCPSLPPFLLAEVPSFILLLPRATRFFRPRLFLLVLQLVGKYETAEIEDGSEKQWTRNGTDGGSVRLGIDRSRWRDGDRWLDGVSFSLPP